MWTGIWPRTTIIALPIPPPEERIQENRDVPARDALILKCGREFSVTFAGRKGNENACLV